MKTFSRFCAIVALVFGFTAVATAQTELFDASKASITSTWFNPGWAAGDAGDPEAGNATWADGKLTINILKSMNQQWQAQVFFGTGVAFEADKYYEVTFKATTNKNVGGITLKIDDMLYLDQSVEVKADGGLEFKSGALKGVAVENAVLIFDLGWAGEGTELVCSEFSVQEVAEPEPEPVVEGTEIFDAAKASILKTYVNPGWGGVNSDALTAEWADSKLTVKLNANFNGQWQAQVFLSTGVDFSAEKQYNVSFTLLANKDCGGVTLKLVDADACMFAENADLKANEEYKFEKNSVQGVDATNGELIFDFGWGAEGTEIVISNISIEVIGDEPIVEPIEEAITVTFTVPEDWENVNLWAWNDEGNIFEEGWPGHALEIVDGKVSYTFDATVESVQVIFNNGTVQTVDGAAITESTCYEVGEVQDNGQYALVVVDCEEETAVTTIKAMGKGEVKKMIIDGQLHIVMPDGRHFNLLGAEIQ